MSVAGIWSFWFKQLGMVAPNNQFFGLVAEVMRIQIKHDLAISKIEPLPIRWKPCLVDRFFRAESQPIPRYIWLNAGKLTHLLYLLLAHYQTVYLWFNGVIRLGVNPDSSKSVIWGDCGSGISSAMRNAPAYVFGPNRFSVGTDEDRRVIEAQMRESVASTFAPNGKLFQAFRRKTSWYFLFFLNKRKTVKRPQVFWRKHFLW